MESNTFTIIIPLIVFSISFFLSMLGLGGGQLYVPLFYWLGMNLKSEAIPLGLLLNFITQVSAATTYVRSKLVDVFAGIPLIISSMIFPFVGAYFTHKISARLIILIIGVLLILVSVQTLFNWKPMHRDFSHRGKVIIGFGAGSAVGFIVGFLGRGGGSFVVPTLLFIGFSAKHAAATSAFICTFSSLTGFLAHAKYGRIDITLTAISAIAALVGSQIGSRLMAKKIKENTIKIIFAIVLLLIGIQLITKEILY